MSNTQPPRSAWSDELKSLSEHILNDMPMAPFAAGFCSLKHVSGKYATIGLEDCLLRKYKLYDMQSGILVDEFDSVYELLQNGWAVD